MSGSNIAEGKKGVGKPFHHGTHAILEDFEHHVVQVEGNEGDEQVLPQEGVGRHTTHSGLR